MELAASATAAIEPPRAPREPSGPGRDPVSASWLGRIAYRDAWRLQKGLVAARAADEIGDQLLLLEHPAVLTLGRQADESHVLARPSQLRARGIEAIRVERGGEVTYHGPGQLVAYPILSIARRGLLLRPLVRGLEAAMEDTCAALGVVAGRREGHPGCWCALGEPGPRKIGALGLRVERGVTYHGIALNVAPDLRDFELIDPCGLPGVVSTSIAEELGRTAEAPSTERVAEAARIFATALATQLDLPIDGLAEPFDDTAALAAVGRLEALVESAAESAESAESATAGTTAAARTPAAAVAAG